MALVRRNQAMMSRPEKAQYVQAVLKLKETGVYDNCITEHVEITYYGHGGPSFLPWHREFRRRFERDLQDVNPAVTLPYWDWTVDNSENASIWDDVFMGGNGRSGDRMVTAGQFAGTKGQWKCLRIDVGADDLTREFGVHIGSLPTAKDVVADCLLTTPYDSPPWDGSSDPSFRNYLEGGIGPNIHNRVHQWVGGHMLPLSSPNDPVFFLRHANTDRLWAEWQYNQGAPYEPPAGGPQGQNDGDAMIRLGWRDRHRQRPQPPRTRLRVRHGRACRRRGPHAPGRRPPPRRFPGVRGRQGPPPHLRLHAARRPGAGRRPQRSCAVEQRPVVCCGAAADFPEPPAG